RYHAANRRVFSSRVVRSVRAVPRGHRPARGGAPSAVRPPGIARDGSCPHRRARAGDARRVDLRARADGVGGRAGGHQETSGGWMIQLSSDGRTTHAPEGTTILQACNAQGIDTPTLCHLRTLTPVNACRLCVVELEGARTLAPACSRKVETGMVVRTNTDRVRH